MIPYVTGTENPGLESSNNSSDPVADVSELDVTIQIRESCTVQGVDVLNQI